MRQFFKLGETNSEFIRLMEDRTVAMHPPPISNDCHPEWAELSWIMETKAIKHHLGSTTMEGFSEHSLRVVSMRFRNTWHKPVFFMRIFGNGFLSVFHKTFSASICQHAMSIHQKKETWSAILPTSQRPTEIMLKLPYLKKCSLWWKVVWMIFGLPALLHPEFSCRILWSHF